MDIVCEVENATVYALKDGERVGQTSVPDIDFHWGEGVYVSLAGIAGVGTRAEFRRKGIATRMMEEARRFALEKGYCCSGLSTNWGNVARRLYSRAGYTTLFQPGRFEKRLEKRGVPEAPGVAVRPYREGDEACLMRLFERVYAPFFGWRKKTSARWNALRKEIREQDPEFIFVAEDEEGVQGWAGCFRQWVGLAAELYVRPSARRRPIAQSLLVSLENHLLSQGVEEAHFWLSPKDAFSAHLLFANGYTFRARRVFMLSILDLPQLLGVLLPLFDRRLKGGPPWKGVIGIQTPVQGHSLRIGEGVSLEERGRPDAEVAMPQEVLVRLVSGALGFREAYLEGLLTVEPEMMPGIDALLETLFPEVPWHHPADDLW
ncbi:MAG: hypothetical protein A3F84_29700 [Candidatus Handelsmanbacteria bacterium RIFCSPLOWO2_12_FULL_64_10]|uniref:N-acetyltransferase domain-containing protein n=1 Tax=Handelsmanbacteria sp. (strain RIFCSPLOWO2_12_FULL_64_10) TaxID=1817868 RepID=A0A1F6D3B7_HANXR|nr:MAG: hypothetical protein A3F84_29700 [Candidatus Handelsmanbacteria bacterium RIFCSPLOWO2_12_FULL_64_10]